MAHDTNTTHAAQATKAKKAPRNWQCNECGYRMTAERAFSALYGITAGCPKCNGRDIDLAESL